MVSVVRKMNFDLIIDVGPAVMAACVLLSLFAGFIKGTVGFALPMILISGLATFLPAEVALAGMIIPSVVANTYQAFRNGAIAAHQSVKDHRVYLGVLLVVLVLSAQLVTLLPSWSLFLIVGVPISLMATLQLVGWRPKVDPSRRRTVEVGAGFVSGFLGGMTGAWGTATVFYLTALSTPKIEQMRVQGVVFAAGSFMFFFAHLTSGILTAPSLTLSAVLLVPVLIGLGIGYRLNARLDQEKFRTVTLIVLILAGLNLIRRGLLG